jgi:hypothetical protein
MAVQHPISTGSTSVQSPVKDGEASGQITLSGLYIPPSTICREVYRELCSDQQSAVSEMLRKC